MIRSGLMRSALAAALALLSPGAARAACALGKIAELPVVMEGTRPIVSAQINGQEVRFLADSGAFYSLISPGAAAQLHLHPTPLNGVRLQGIGGDAELSVTTVKIFTLAGTPLHDVEFAVGGSEVRSDAVGLLGQNVLGLADAEYDLAGGAIRLMKPRDCGRSDLAYWASGKPVAVIDIRPPEPRDRHTIGTILVNGVRLRAMFDTGASASILSLAGAARAGVKPGGPGVVPAGYAFGLGRGRVQTWVAPFDNIAIGGEEVRHTRLQFGGDGFDNTDMVVGADFFLSHRVYVANSQSKLYATYNGGPVFSLAVDLAAAVAQAGRAADGETPTDAEGFSQRGGALAARRQFQAAVSDLNHAVALAPGEPRYLYQRALVHAAWSQSYLAMADVDAALALKPDDVQAHVVRAQLRLRDRDPAGATEDLDAAAAHAPREADVRLQIAGLYESVDAFVPAIAQYDAWIVVHPDDSRRGEALNGRCWTRALLGRELDRALGDCDAAIRIRRDPRWLDSRGLVRLRRGEFDRAIADYDAALALAPKTAWSLYGRGVARSKKGQDGSGDLAAAAALAPKLPDRARKLGIEP